MDLKTQSIYNNTRKRSKRERAASLVDADKATECKWCIKTNQIVVVLIRCLQNKDVWQTTAKDDNSSNTAADIIARSYQIWSQQQQNQVLKSSSSKCYNE